METGASLTVDPVYTVCLTDWCACSQPSIMSGQIFRVNAVSFILMQGMAKAPKNTIITKTCLYNFDPLKSHFYIVKLGFTGVYIIILISAQNRDCWYSLELPRWDGSNEYPQSMFWADCGYLLEPPRWGSSNEYPQSMFWAETWKITEFFIWKFSFFDGKIFSIFE